MFSLTVEELKRKKKSPVHEAAAGKFFDTTKRAVQNQSVLRKVSATVRKHT